MSLYPSHAAVEAAIEAEATAVRRYREQQRRAGRPVPDPAPPAPVANPRRVRAADVVRPRPVKKAKPTEKPAASATPPAAAVVVPPGHLLLTPPEVAAMDRMLSTHPDLRGAR